MDQNHRDNPTPEVNLCRFCLRPKRTMWPLKTLYRKDGDFLHKIYQCSHINIIDMNELFTWVCRSCRQNIEKFSAFQNMLHKNLATFESRFREEQQLNSNWNDDPQQQQRQVVNVRFGDLEDDNEDDLSDLDHFEPGQPASLASSDSGNQSEDSQLPEDCALGDSRKGLRIE
ncbi:hypothetical protein quinque_011578 [Culex quinquefasciatus]|uniref:uncharacterized protein LOC119767527 n=1 Tax=Culex quinquefasciatus TaxID=7176 RepID=UPI0018E3CE3D|nr:uncharacterized protein LOC119767527 [Culex quinquefasciatus]